MLRKSSPEKSTPQAEFKRAPSTSTHSSRTPPPSAPAPARQAISAAGGMGGAVTQKDLTEVIERIACLEMAQRESSRTLGSILLLVEGVSSQPLQSQGQEDTLKKIAELARKAQQELSK